jgi:hypothetical protein
LDLRLFISMRLIQRFLGDAACHASLELFLCCLY